MAPDGGGPATYVDDGVTGFLTATWHVDRLAAAIGSALDASLAETDARPGRRSHETVAKSFTIQRMAGHARRRLRDGVAADELAARSSLVGHGMTLLVISPDYASHLLPLAALGTAWRDAGERVVVACGDATAGIVDSFGYERADLQLGRGSNPGVIRAEKQPDDEADSLRGFFDATRRGMVPTLAYQARERLVDLMWQPVEKARATLGVVDAVRPDAILVDHLAYGARLGLWAGDVPYADVVLGHPTALPVGGRGLRTAAGLAARVPARPGRARPSSTSCAVGSPPGSRREWNAAAPVLAPGIAPVEDAFALHGPLVLYHYPERAGRAGACVAPPAARVPRAAASAPSPPIREVDAWLRGRGAVRLRQLRQLPVRPGRRAAHRGGGAARGGRAGRDRAAGPPRSRELGELPAGWLVREYLPQVRLLRERPRCW